MKKSQAEIITNFKLTHLTSVWNFNWDEKHIFKGETHILWEIVYVVSGSVRVTEDENVYNLREGNMIVHAPMEFHSIRSADGTRPNVYIVSFLSEGDLPENLTNGILYLTEEEQKEYKELFGRIYEFFYSEQRDSFKGQECTNYLSAFLIRINFNHTAQPKILTSHSAMEYKKVILCMTEHIHDNCSLEEIASLCNTSVSNIKVLFGKYHTTSPKLHYARLRCTEAIKLMSSGLSATETANKLNFSSPNYFNTFFKRMTGRPPATFNRSSSNIDFM